MTVRSGGLGHGGRAGPRAFACACAPVSACGDRVRGRAGLGTTRVEKRAEARWQWQGVVTAGAMC
eukprot:4964582-Prymnesium_polylepis.1